MARHRHTPFTLSPLSMCMLLTLPHRLPPEAAPLAFDAADGLGAERVGAAVVAGDGGTGFGVLLDGQVVHREAAGVEVRGVDGHVAAVRAAAVEAHVLHE